MRYALSAAPMALPRVAATSAARFSVPRPSGGYDYYEAPPGSAIAQNDDLPVPVLAHGNPLGVSCLTVGRALPPGARRIGSGDAAIGSITPLPGVRSDGPLATGLGGDGLGFVATDEDVTVASKAGALAIAVSAAIAAGVVYKALRG